MSASHLHHWWPFPSPEQLFTSAAAFCSLLFVQWFFRESLIRCFPYFLYSPLVPLHTTRWKVEILDWRLPEIHKADSWHSQLLSSLLCSFLKYKLVWLFVEVVYSDSFVDSFVELFVDLFVWYLKDLYTH